MKYLIVLVILLVIIGFLIHHSKMKDPKFACKAKGGAYSPYDDFMKWEQSCAVNIQHFGSQSTGELLLWKKGRWMRGSEAAKIKNLE